VLARETILRHAQTSLLHPELLEVGGQASALELWHAVLLRAEREHRIESVVTAVLEENPGADELRATWERFRRRRPETPPAEPERPPQHKLRILGVAGLGLGVVGAALWVGRAESTPWIEIPAGPALLGGCDNVHTCLERRTVDVPRFEILRTEVTVAEYRKCVDAGVCETQGLEHEHDDACEAPRSSMRCTWRAEPGGTDDHPLNCVDWFQAQRYCAWAGGRLPIDDEWEKATRGRDGLGYPWGEHAEPQALGSLANGYDIQALRAIFQNDALATKLRQAPSVVDYVDGFLEVAPTGSFPRGASPYGLLDAIGNVQEWTWERRHRGGGWRTWTGGSHLVPEASWRAPPVWPGWRDAMTGFRCVRSSADPPGEMPNRESLPELLEPAWLEERRKAVDAAAERIRETLVASQRSLETVPEAFLDAGLDWGHIALPPTPSGEAPISTKNWILERISTVQDGIESCLALLGAPRGSNWLELSFELDLAAPGAFQGLRPGKCTFYDRTQSALENPQTCPEVWVERAVECLAPVLRSVDYGPLCRGGTSRANIKRFYSR